MKKCNLDNPVVEFGGPIVLGLVFGLFQCVDDGWPVTMESFASSVCWFILTSLGTYCCFGAFYFKKMRSRYDALEEKVESMRLEHGIVENVVNEVIGVARVPNGNVVAGPAINCLSAMAMSGFVEIDKCYSEYFKILKELYEKSHDVMGVLASRPLVLATQVEKSDDIKQIFKITRLKENAGCKRFVRVAVLDRMNLIDLFCQALLESIKKKPTEKAEDTRDIQEVFWITEFTKLSNEGRLYWTTLDGQDGRSRGIPVRSGKADDYAVFDSNLLIQYQDVYPTRAGELMGSLVLKWGDKLNGHRDALEEILNADNSSRSTALETSLGIYTSFRELIAKGLNGDEKSAIMAAKKEMLADQRFRFVRSAIECIEDPIDLYDYMVKRIGISESSELRGVFDLKWFERDG